MAKAKPTGKRQEKQRQIDPVFKQALTDELANLPAVLQTEVEVSRPSVPASPRLCSIMQSGFSSHLRLSKRGTTDDRDSRRST